jgi:hypothetical protein
MTDNGGAATQVDRGSLQRCALDRIFCRRLERCDARGALLRQWIALVNDGEPHGMSVGGQEQLDAPLEVGVVEGFRRKVERVVVLGRIERIAHRGGVALRGHGLVLLSLLRLVLVQHHLLLIPHRLDHRRHDGDHYWSRYFRNSLSERRMTGTYVPKRRLPTCRSLA